MSSLYNLEPPPTAKVLLRTTLGDLSLELFAKQTPLASRNFLQLCLDGYYDNTIFHRLVPGFVIQGGDPTGTGSGGLSSYNGEPFADEFHSRLRFNRRGLLGMANTGKDENGSQFFLTLDKTDELQGKNTMFGRIEGDTIYNLMKMGEAELAEEGSERPLYPTKILGAEVLVNPFEDMVKRVVVADRTAEEKRPKLKAKKKAARQLLSFGADDGEADAAPAITKAKFNPKLVSAGEQSLKAVRDTTMSEASKTGPAKPTKEHVARSPSPPPASRPVPKPSSKPREPTPSPSLSPEPEPVKGISSALERTNAQISQLKASMRRDVARPAEKTQKKSALEAMIPDTSMRGRKRKKGTNHAAEYAEALDLFNAFKSKLEGVGPDPSRTAESATPNESNDVTHSDGKAGDASGQAGDDGEAELCDLHFIANCQSCKAWDQQVGAETEKDEDGGIEWMAHTLSFAKDRLGKDLEWKRKNEEELVLIDPREKARELGDGRGDERAGRGKTDGKARNGNWARDRKKVTG